MSEQEFRAGTFPPKHLKSDASSTVQRDVAPLGSETTGDGSILVRQLFVSWLCAISSHMHMVQQFLQGTAYFFDPMAPLDFGIDLSKISSSCDANPGKPPLPTPNGNGNDNFLLSPSLDLPAVVPSEPWRDGMVPNYTVTTGRQQTLPPPRRPKEQQPPPRRPKEQHPPPPPRPSTALPHAPVITTGCIGYFPSASTGIDNSTHQKRHASKAKNPAKLILAPPADRKTRNLILARWRNKKAKRYHKKNPVGTVMYESRKRSALIKPRINGKFVSAGEYEKYVSFGQNEQDKPTDQSLHQVPFA